MSSLAAASADGYYRSPDGDVLSNSKGKYQKSRNANGGVIRFALPFNGWCLGCNKHLAKATRFNAKKQAANEKYLNITIWMFHMNCPSCSQSFVIQTHPQNASYVYISGIKLQALPTINGEVHNTTSGQGPSLKMYKGVYTDVLKSTNSINNSSNSCNNNLDPMDQLVNRHEEHVDKEEQHGTRFSAKAQDSGSSVVDAASDLKRLMQRQGLNDDGTEMSASASNLKLLTKDTDLNSQLRAKNRSQRNKATAAIASGRARNVDVPLVDTTASMFRDAHHIMRHRNVITDKSTKEPRRREEKLKKRRVKLGGQHDSLNNVNVTAKKRKSNTTNNALDLISGYSSDNTND